MKNDQPPILSQVLGIGWAKKLVEAKLRFPNPFGFLREDEPNTIYLGLYRGAGKALLHAMRIQIDENGIYGFQGMHFREDFYENIPTYSFDQLWKWLPKEVLYHDNWLQKRASDTEIWYDGFGSALRRREPDIISCAANMLLSLNQLGLLKKHKKRRK